VTGRDRHRRGALGGGGIPFTSALFSTSGGRKEKRKRRGGITQKKEWEKGQRTAHLSVWWRIRGRLIFTLRGGKGKKKDKKISPSKGVKGKSQREHRFYHTD